MVLGEAMSIEGFQLAPDNMEVGQEAVLTLAWKPASAFDAGLSVFAHLIGPEGQLYAQQDLPAVAHSEGLTLTQFRLTPRPGSGPGQYDVLVGAYGEAPLLNPAGQTRTSISTIGLTAAPLPLATRNPTYRNLVEASSSKRLVGYDWDNTLTDRRRLYLHWQTDDGYWSEIQDLAQREFQMPSWHGPWGIEVTKDIVDGKQPDYYVPFGQGIVWVGEPINSELPVLPNDTVEISQYFAGSRPINRDLIGSVRLVGFEDDGYHWAWWDLDDGVPAMGAIPTLKWISGSWIRDPHWTTVGDTAWPGQATGPILRLYDAFTGRPLPILDERISQETPWVPLGTTTVGE